MALGIGQSLGNYRIVQKLGAGAMGAVYLAEHPLIGKRVALKVIHRDLSMNQEVVTRFFHEARAVNQIGHEHIVDITDFGQTPEGEYFFIMELLSGRSLADLIELDGALPVVRALHVGQQMADALGASHAVGIVHRDLKPDNVYLIHRRGDGDFVKLLDFGLAKISQQAGGASVTRRGVLLGTPQYMSPEQCESMTEVDPRSDIYSLGILLYQMMTGAVPFDGEGMGEVLLRQVNEAPAPPRARNPEIPPSVEAVILRALHKRPEHRFQSMRELRAALLDPDAYAALEPGVAPTTMLPPFTADILSPDGPTPPPAAMFPGPAPPHRVEVRVRKERRGRMWLLLGLATAGVAAAVMLVVLRGRTTAAPRAPTPPASVAPPTPDAAPPTLVVVPLPMSPPEEKAPDPPPPRPPPAAATPRPKPARPKPAKRPPPKPGDEILEPTF